MTAKKNAIKVGDADIVLDPEAMYRVSLNAPRQIGGIWYRPGSRNSKLRGDMLLASAKDLAGVLVTVEPAPAEDLTLEVAGG